MPLTNQVTLGTDGRFLADDPAQASLKINPNSGAFTGTFLSAGTTFRFEGAMLQKQNSGSGYFLGMSSGGRIRVLPAP
jgi:hypothetical protein